MTRSEITASPRLRVSLSTVNHNHGKIAELDSNEIRAELLFLQELGFTHLSLPAVVSVPSEPYAPSPSLPLAPAELADLGLVCSVCQLCRLARTRTKVVFGVGNPRAELMFIGEGPGRDEDLAGEPFVGRAGQLLTEIIKAMKLTREQVYITNVVKCRPPENRNPEQDEMDACRPYLQKQIALINPKVIVTLGRYAVQSTLQKPVPISSVRGMWQSLGGIKVMPTFHPAYLLRNPAAKKEVWSDMKKVMAELGIAS